MDNNLSHTFNSVPEHSPAKHLLETEEPSTPSHWFPFLMPALGDWAGQEEGSGRRTVLFPMLCPWPTNRKLSGFTGMFCNNSPQSAQPPHKRHLGWTCLATMVNSTIRPFTVPFSTRPFPDWMSPQGRLPWSIPSKFGLGLFSLKASSHSFYIAWSLLDSVFLDHIFLWTFLLAIVPELKSKSN